MPGISFDALRCTFSIAVMCFCRWGFHTEWAYSRCSLTIEVNNILNMPLSKYSKERLIRLTRVVALVTLVDICLSNDSLESMKTPKSFSSVELLSISSSIEYSALKSGLFPILMETHLSGWNFNKDSLVQLNKRFRSCWRSSISCWQWISLKIFVSSA